MKKGSTARIIFGDIAVEMDLVSRDQVQGAAEYQELEELGCPIGEVMEMQGLLSSSEIDSVLAEQTRKMDKVEPRTGRKLSDVLFGRLAVENGFISEEELRQVLREQAGRRYRDRQVKLGSLLVERNLLTRNQVNEILTIQKSKVILCEKCGAEFDISSCKPGTRARCGKCSNVFRIPVTNDSLENTISLPEPGGSSSTFFSSLEHENPGYEEDDGAPEVTGKMFGGCRIESIIGRGGMGRVYLAKHNLLNQYRAIKILPVELSRNRMYIVRFFKEARAVANLQHKNIIQVYDAGEAEGLYYFSMEYVEGKNVNEILQETGGAMVWAKTVEIIIQVLESFKVAHGKNIVHRDIKPENIMIADDMIVKVADFGLAKDISEATGLTKTGQIMGTPQYMSPEQCRGEVVDHRTDIYSLGATWYTMLAGYPMFRASTPIAVIHKQVYEDPLPLEQVAPDVPKGIVSIVEKMIAKDPDQRYRNAEDVLDALKETMERIMEETNAQTIIKGRNFSGLIKSGGEGKRRFIGLTVGVLTAVLLAAVVLLVFFSGSEGDGDSLDVNRFNVNLTGTSVERNGTGETASSGTVGGETVANGPTEEERKARERESQSKKAEADKMRRSKVLSGMDEIDKMLNDSEYSKEIQIPENLESAVKLDDEVKRLRELRERVAQYNAEVQRIKKETDFRENLEEATNQRNWSKVLALLSSKKGLDNREKKLLMRARIEESVFADLSGKKFSIGKYEVTVAQYEDFIEEGGYNRKTYWSHAGWKWKERNHIKTPLYWNDESFKIADYPVVGVSYYEAEAYARWAGGRLPSCVEWKAGAGADKWPWGDSTIQDIANCRDVGLGKPCSVDLYSKDLSPCGCVSMAGNVMEWCTNGKNETDSGAAVCMGGSWRTWLENSTCESVCDYNPSTREDHIGFRIVRDLK